MRSMAFALALLLTFGAAQAFPLYGGNAQESKCAVFDAYKNPLPAGYDVGDASQTYYHYYVDAAFIGLGDEASFGLADQEDNIYVPDMNFTLPLQPGRILLAFVIPYDAEIKGLMIKPTEGDTFGVAWDPVEKYTNGVVNLRYYGIGGWGIDLNQTVVLEVSISNNGTVPMVMAPQNFTILDQWGWRYYCDDTFSPMDMEAKTMAKLWLRFTDMAPRSRPVVLEYDYNSPAPILIALEAEAVYAAEETSAPSATQASTGEATSATTVASTPQTTAPAPSPSSSVSDAMARLEAVRRPFGS